MAFRTTAARLAPAAESSGLWAGLQSWAKRASGYRKYGLHREDLIMEELPGVKEAISRLPQEEQDKRFFRMKRAMNVSLRQQYLPKEEWTTEEEDSKSYLKPVLAQVQKELEEKKAWDNQ